MAKATHTPQERVEALYEPSETIICREIEDFTSYFCPYGSMDINYAVAYFLKAGKDSQVLFEEIERFSQECDTKIKDIDPCGIAYETILQEARNEIHERAGYDFLNDFKGETAIYTFGNYLDTSYHYSEKAKEELQKKLQALNKEDKNDLRENDSVALFLSELDICM